MAVSHSCTVISLFLPQGLFKITFCSGFLNKAPPRNSLEISPMHFKICALPCSKHGKGREKEDARHVSPESKVRTIVLCPRALRNSCAINRPFSFFFVNNRRHLLDRHSGVVFTCITHQLCLALQIQFLSFFKREWVHHTLTW